MAYELNPNSGELLPAAEVARLISTEFAYVKIDAEDAMTQAQARAEWIEHAPAHIFLGHHQKALETAAMLRNLAAGDALTVEFGDDESDTLRAVVIPGETIKFGYRTSEEQAASRPLVERCARVLSCDVTEI
jgi:hypothetical protein